MVDVIPEEAVHEQKHRYITDATSGHWYCTTNTQQSLMFSPTFIWIPSAVSNNWHITPTGCPSLPAWPGSQHLWYPIRIHPAPHDCASISAPRQ